MAEKSWGGVFQQATDRRVEKFTESVSFDRRLYAHDVRGSIAHAKMLAKVGLISADECQQIVQGLEDIRQEIEQDQFAFDIAAEDIHMHIELALVDRLGDVGRRLHTARSRNDQVSTDLRLWVRESIDHLVDLIADVQRAFVVKADADRDVIVPAYTHLQRAQPVLASHYWLAYCEKFERDRQRLIDARKRVNRLPLGTAALAGTTLPIDRQYVADQLGFEGLMANSLDASSDRDFALEFAFDMTAVAEHLSGWAEEWILWSTTEFGYLKLPEAFCTGSSIMPQKVNPDVLELVRGKTARVIGNLVALVTLVKGLPLAYNRDLQEDKPPLFDSFDTVVACLELAAPVVEGARLQTEAIAERLECGYLDATTLMEYLIGRGVPQRTAHEMIGSLVRTAMDRGVPLAGLLLADFQDVLPELDKGVFDVLGARRSIEAFVSYGSTGRVQVAQQIDRWKERLA